MREVLLLRGYRSQQRNPTSVADVEVPITPFELPFTIPRMFALNHVRSLRVPSLFHEHRQNTRNQKEASVARLLMEAVQCQASL